MNEINKAGFYSRNQQGQAFILRGVHFVANETASWTFGSRDW